MRTHSETQTPRHTHTLAQWTRMAVITAGAQTNQSTSSAIAANTAVSFWVKALTELKALWEQLGMPLAASRRLTG